MGRSGDRRFGPTPSSPSAPGSQFTQVLPSAWVLSSQAASDASMFLCAAAAAAAAQLSRRLINSALGLLLADSEALWVMVKALSELRRVM